MCVYIINCYSLVCFFCHSVSLFPSMSHTLNFPSLSVSLPTPSPSPPSFSLTSSFSKDHFIAQGDQCCFEGLLLNNTKFILGESCGMTFLSQDTCQWCLWGDAFSTRHRSVASVSHLMG